MHLKLYEEERDHSLRRNKMIRNDIKKYRHLSNKRHFQDNEASLRTLSQKFESEFERVFEGQV